MVAGGDDVQITLLPDYVSVYTWYTVLTPDPLRPRGRATPASHGSTRGYRRNNGPQRQTRREGGVERSAPGIGLRNPGVCEEVRRLKMLHR